MPKSDQGVPASMLWSAKGQPLRGQESGTERLLPLVPFLAVVDDTRRAVGMWCTALIYPVSDFVGVLRGKPAAIGEISTAPYP